MQALSSVSPHSKVSAARPRALDVPAFSLDPREREEPRAAPPAPTPPELLEREPLARACALASAEARAESLAELASLTRSRPEILKAAHVSRDERGTPIQAFPALALAAISGDDPEGWAPLLAAMGARFDTRDAREAAREELLEMGSARGGRLLALNARCDALSIWTLACAEARHPHSALRAVDALRHLLPLGLAPLESELARFETDPAWDKPSLRPATRAGAFVEAARSAPDFFARTLPAWILGPRGSDLAAIADPLGAALDPRETRDLREALMGKAEPAAATLLSALTPEPATPF